MSEIWLRTSYYPPRSLRDAIPQWCVWVILSTFGLALPVAIAALVGSYLFLALLPLVAGVVVGSAQWLFLRSLPRASRWLLATSSGYLLLGFGFAVDAFVYGVAMVAESGIFGGTPMPGEVATWYALSSLLLAVFSIPLGLLQFRFLRGRFSRPGAWIPATCAAWFLVSLILLSADLTMPTTAVPVVVLAAAIPPALTGVVLFSLKRKEAPTASSA